MFLFFDHENQNEKNANYYKGKLFEKLLKEYLDKNGYSTTLRVKHNSLEYDIEGKDKTTNITIIGEAKAYQDSISGQTLSAFVGKLLGLGIIKNKIHSIFLSTSPLTPEAKDFFETVKEYGITCYSGEELFSRIIETFNMPTKKQVFDRTLELGYNPLFDYILTTNYGFSRLVIASSTDSMIPSVFIVYNNSLDLISDDKTLSEYQNIKELRGLKFISTKAKNRIDSRDIQQGLMIGKDWTDYRLPAAPEFFVGRKKLVSQIIESITNGTSESKVVQIKSRSGVGKSSMLALLAKRLNDMNCHVELHDARDIKSVVDIFSVIGRFVGSEQPPQDFYVAEQQLSKLANGNNVYVFMVDQFESTFSQPEIFTAYETLAKIIYSLNGKVYFCLARKNDQITTYDDTLVSLNQLNSISKNYELKDFDKNESRELLDNINENAAKKISKEVLGYILEFAQGFPWLLKRTMSHIIKLTSNVSQKQLIDTGLMLDDLFEEELDGLEEIEKEYLTKICSKLPADFHQLQVAFDEDTLLPKILDKLTQVRLLRLTGTTYDTYNDVFKEYLVYQKLPEFKHKHIFRLHPNSTMKFFVKVVNKNRFTISQLSKSLKTSEKSLANYIKECRILGLLRKEDDYWIVPKNIKDMYTQGHLGMHIRRQVLENELASEIVKSLNAGKLSYENVTEIIKTNSPYVEAADATWNLYTNSMLAWLSAIKVVKRRRNNEICLVENSKDLSEALGNMITSAAYSSRSRVNDPNLFLPTVAWKYYESLYIKYREGIREFEGEEKKAFIDFERFGMIELIEKCDTIDEYKKTLINDYLSTPAHIKIWTAAKENKNILIAIAEMVVVEMTPSTLSWRAKKLINWGKSLGLLENKRYSYAPKQK